MKVTKLIVGLSICVLCAGVLVAEANVTGNWELTITSSRGERTSQAEFSQDAEALAVIMEGRQGSKMEAKGSVKGSDIEWTVRRETERGTFEMIYKGKIEGDTMSGTVQFGTRGSGRWSAERAE